MKYALLVVIAACGGGASAPDAGGDAHPRPDAAPPVLAVSMMPNDVVTIPQSSRQMYEATVTNSAGKGTIAATLSDSTSFAITQRYCESGGACIIDIELIPVAQGPLDGVLTLTSDTGETATAHMLANVLQPDVLVFAPDRIDFLGQGVDMTSAPISATITNTGAVASGPLALGIDDATLFHLHGAGCAGQVLAPGAACTFTVDYTPITTTPLGSGGDFANITATATPGGESVTLANGFGLTLTISPQGEVAMPDTPVGQTSAAKTFTVANVLAVPIGPIATSFQIENQDQYAFTGDTCNHATLAAGTSCTMTIVFKPTSAALLTTILDAVAPDFGGYRNDTSVAISATGL